MSVFGPPSDPSTIEIRVAALEQQLAAAIGRVGAVEAAVPALQTSIGQDLETLDEVHQGRINSEQTGRQTNDQLIRDELAEIPIGGGGAAIDDSAPALNKTFSSEKVLEVATAAQKIAPSGLTTTGAMNPRDSFQVGNLVFFTNTDANALETYKLLDDPDAEPVLIATTTHVNMLRPRNVVVQWPFAYVTGQGGFGTGGQPPPGNSVFVFNMAVTDQPGVFVAQKQSANLWQPIGIQIQGSLLAVSDTYSQSPGATTGSRLVFFRVANPANLQELGTWTAPIGHGIAKFQLIGSFAHLTTADAALVAERYRVIDARAPGAPSEFSSAALPAGAGIADLHHVSGFSLLACHGATGGFIIVDACKISAPEVRSFTPLPMVDGAASYSTTGIWSFGRRAGVPDLHNSVLYFYDWTDPYHPQLIPEATIRDGLLSPARLIGYRRKLLSANRAVGITGGGGLGVIDLGGPFIPSQAIGTLSVGALRVDDCFSAAHGGFDHGFYAGGPSWFGGPMSAAGDARVAGTVTAEGVTSLLGGLGVHTLGGVSIDFISDGGVAQQRLISYGNNANHYVCIAGGTEAAPALPATNARGAIQFGAWDGVSQFLRISELRTTLIEPVPSSTMLGARTTLMITPVGQAVPVEIARWDHATGFSLFGANIVIDQNRHFRPRQYTLAAGSFQLPAAAASSGSLAAVTDGAAGTTLVVSDGVRWVHLANIRAIVATGIKSGDITGVTTDVQVGVDRTIPGLGMGLNGWIEIDGYASCTASGNQKRVRVKFGGSACGANITTNAAAVGFPFRIVIQNRGVANSQVVTCGFGDQILPQQSLAIDTTVDQVLQLFGQVGNAADLLNIERYSIRVHYVA